jgi:hypothetical protein
MFTKNTTILKKYKVFHTNKPWMKKGEKKEVEIIETYNRNEAIIKVKEMFPNHKVGRAFLIK